MKIFWSWQSDTPEQIGKYLVRDALKVAINRLKLPKKRLVVKFECRVPHDPANNPHNAALSCKTLQTFLPKFSANMMSASAFSKQSASSLVSGGA